MLEILLKQKRPEWSGVKLMYDFERYLDIAFENEHEMLRIQERLLKNHLEYCSIHSPFYKKIFRQFSVNIDNFTIDCLRDIPFTDKTQFARHNEDFLAVGNDEIVDLALSSGTTGEPTKIMYSERDLQRLAYNEKKSFIACGISEHDRVLLTCTMDRCFVAGLAYFMGIRSLGGTAIRNGLNSIESHLDLLCKLKPTVIVGVPSFLYRMGKYIRENSDTKLMNSVRKLVCIGEPIRNNDFAVSEIGSKLKQIWDADLYSTYASSEAVSTFCECTEGKGGHLHPDLAVLEIVDESGKNLSAGRVGEIVITPLGCTGMPIIRFKTGDISFIDDTPCPCGRNSVRLGPIIGRKQQMLKINGTTLYPQTIYSAIDEIPEITEYYIEVSEKEKLSDKVEIFLALENESISIQKIANVLKSKLRVSIPLCLKNELSMKKKIFNNNSRKPQKFFDNRKNR